MAMIDRSFAFFAAMLGFAFVPMVSFAGIDVIALVGLIWAVSGFKFAFAWFSVKFFLNPSNYSAMFGMSSIELSMNQQVNATIGEHWLSDSLVAFYSSPEVLVASYILFTIIFAWFFKRATGRLILKRIRRNSGNTGHEGIP